MGVYGLAVSRLSTLTPNIISPSAEVWPVAVGVAEDLPQHCTVRVPTKYPHKLSRAG